MNATITACPAAGATRRTPPTPQWELLAPLLPAPASTTATGGHPEAHPRREIVDAIRYLVDNGRGHSETPSVSRT
jgi:hypothetical protein